MEIIDISNYNEKRFGTAVALGNFDGVHKGHRDIIEEMTRYAKANDLKSSLLVFENHTKTLLTGHAPKMLTSTEQKNNIFKSLEVELLYKIKFDEKIMKLLPEEFVKEILIQKLNVKAVVIGFDYKFGHKASGDSKLLKLLGEQYNFEVIIIEPIFIDNELVSSTRIRNLLLEGDILEANKLLGRKFAITGKVVSGKKLGNSLGFPTANIDPIENFIIPKNGVYRTNTIVDGRTYLSATSVGKNPTFQDNGLKIESHIIDFNGDIYGETVELEFVEYLREEMKFKDLEELKKWVQADINRVKNGQ